MRCRSNRTLALVTCWLALAAGLSAQESKSPVTGGQSSVSDAAETREQLETLLSETRAELAALPAEPPADSAEARRQTALERRLALATEFLALVASEETLKSELADAQGRVDQVREEHDALEGLAPPKPPPAPTKADYEAVNQALSASRGLVAGLRRAALERSARAEQAPTQGTEARERLTRATVVIQELSTQLGDAVTEAERGLLELRLENARLEADLARRKETHLSALVAAEKELEPVRAAAMVLEESRLARRESEFQAYGSAMEELLAKERQELDRQLTQSQQEAGQAVTPAERFLAKWRTAGLQFKQNAGALEGQLVGLDKEIGEQEKLLQAEQEELTGLKDFVLRSGVVGRAAERIKQTHQRIKVRTELLTRSLASRFEGLLSAQRARRLEIEEDQLGLAERFPSERQAVLDQLTPEVGAAFKSEASGLLEDYRSALRDEKSLVTDVITKGSRLQSLIQDRLLSLGALERFVRSKLFRIRDGEILGWGVVRGVGEELSSIVEWARSTFSQGSLGRLRESSQTPGNLAIALLLFPLLPIVLFVLRQRVRSFVRSRNQRTVDRGRNLANSSLAILGGLISATLLPFYLYLAGRFIGSAELHPNLDPVLSRTVIHIAFVLFA